MQTLGGEREDTVKRIVMPGVILVTALIAYGPVAEASPPAPVAITIEQQLTGPTSAAGTFTAVGAFSDSGEYVEDFSLRPSGTIQGTKTLTSQRGTMTLRSVAKLVFTGPTTAVAEGRWVIVSGTGDFSRLHGQGSVTVSVDFATGTAVAIHEGEAHFD
jgi:hypothetical protein